MSINDKSNEIWFNGFAKNYVTLQEGKEEWQFAIDKYLTVKQGTLNRSSLCKILAILQIQFVLLVSFQIKFYFKISSLLIH